MTKTGVLAAGSIAVPPENEAVAEEFVALDHNETVGHEILRTRNLDCSYLHLQDNVDIVDIVTTVDSVVDVDAVLRSVGAMKEGLGHKHRRGRRF
jgi:hypothetical protein